MKIQGKRVLVTGGAGFIGSHLVDELARDNDVTVVDDLSVGRAANLGRQSGRVRLHQADIADPDTCRQQVQEAEVIFHLAVSCLRVSIGDPMRSHDVNDLGTLNLLMAARHGRLERFVYCSSSEVYGTAHQVPMDESHPLNPMTPYAASKLAGEAYSLSFFRTYGFPAMVVRPFNTYGPRSHLEGTSGEVIPKFVARALAGKPLMVFGDGGQTRDYTWVGDTARGIRLAAECDGMLGGIVNVARGEEVSVLDIARLVERLVGKAVDIQHLPERPGDVRRHQAGTRRARELFGFRAEVGIEEGLARYLDWVRDQPGDPLSWLQREEVISWAAAETA